MTGKNGASIHWGGFDKATQNLIDVLQAKKKILLNTIGVALIDSTKQRFHEGKDPSGKKWEVSGRAWQSGLSQKGRKATPRRRGKAWAMETGKFGKTLLNTGRLRDSISHATSSNSVYVGSNLKYARIHNNGGKTGRGHKVTMPQRRFLGISEADKAEARHIMYDFLSDAFKE